MSDKPHEVLDLAKLRREAPEPTLSAPEMVRARLKGRSFSQLTPSEKDELLMAVGCELGIIVPETPER
jgi:hypothetical protein